jgi:8-oxo-dGTP pyrophosphatase MutT (NUDIX family)
MGEKRYAAAGGIVIDDGHMLVLDRPSRGEVRLPKGHIEAGEDAAETALRETMEESGYADLGIVTDLGSQVVEFEYEGSHVVRTEHYFLLHLHSQTQVKRGKQDTAQFQPVWLPLDQVAEQLTYLAEQEVARRAIAAYTAQS